MSLTLLFDLDDTLLDTNMDAFVPAYFQALGNHMGSRVAPELMLRALVHGMNLMNESNDPTRTLQNIFETDFYAKLGIPKDDLAETLEEFYDNVFPSIGTHINPRN